MRRGRRAIADVILVAVLSLAGTLFGSIAGILTANKMTNYRLQQLEKQVERHNSLIERTALLERDLGTVWKRLDSLKNCKEEP